jgi:hypothetical protein
MLAPTMPSSSRGAIPKRATCGLDPAGGKKSALPASASAATRIRGDEARKLARVCGGSALLIDVE